MTWTLVFYLWGAIVTIKNTEVAQEIFDSTWSPEEKCALTAIVLKMKDFEEDLRKIAAICNKLRREKGLPNIVLNERPVSELESQVENLLDK